MAIFAQILVTFVALAFVAYVWVEAQAMRRNRSVAPAPPAPPGDAVDEQGFVSVLLPVRDEKLVVEKLLNAVAALDYPKDKLEIIVLDDSCDDTGDVIRRAVKKLADAGRPVRVERRETRDGFKAGNLTFGLTKAKGEFIAIFDADCLPPADFLRKVIPFFADKKVGFLQTKVTYVNADHTFLTRFQAAEAGHKEEVTEGFSKDGFMASLTGSSCVWRRSCIDAIGGVSDDTITEDVDMGYAAQLSDWKYVFPADVVSRAELPESMAAFRVQRQRWARGLAHNAVRHAKKLFLSPMSAAARLRAVALVFSPLLLALFYFLLLAAPLIALATPGLGLYFNLCCGVILVAAALWGWLNAAGAGGEKTSLVREILDVVAYVFLFFPLSLYYFSAIIQIACFGKGGFYNTPKGCGREKIIHPPINKILLAFEIFSFLYALGTAGAGFRYGNGWVAFYGFISACGFAMTLFFSFSDSRRKVAPGSHILITGASGALGSALAREYAAPGTRLTLQGRSREKLAVVAAQCRDKGASVNEVILDLADTENARAWAEKLAASNPPDMILANAGLNANIGADGAGETYEETMALARVNFLAVLALVHALLPPMRAAGKGQIGVVSSLGGYYGLTTTPTYCATKAALKSYGNSLRGWLAPEGVRVSVILPGYVKSPMCDAMPGPKPFLWTPERAARRIRKGLERDMARVAFPFPLNLGVWGLSILPAALAFPIARWLGYGR